MPAFGDRLSHQEIIEVLAYVKSLWGDKSKRGMSIQESQALASEQDPVPIGWKVDASQEPRVIRLALQVCILLAATLLACTGGGEDTGGHPGPP